MVVPTFDVESVRVLCSAGKGELSARQCLDCALASVHPDCGYDYSLLKPLMRQQDRRNTIHVSDLLGCPKRAYLSKVSRSAEYIHEKLTRMLGVVVHAGLEDSDEHVTCELEIEWDGLQGTMDIYYKSGRIIDLKSTRWIYPEKLPYASHALQVNIYAEMLRQKGEKVESAAIQYIDMSGPTKCRKCKQVLRPDVFGLVCPVCGQTPKGAHLGAVLVEIPLMSRKDIQDLMRERKNAIELALECGIEPEPEPSYLCGYCSYRESCEAGIACASEEI